MMSLASALVLLALAPAPAPAPAALHAQRVATTPLRTRALTAHAIWPSACGTPAPVVQVIVVNAPVHGDVVIVNSPVYTRRLTNEAPSSRMTSTSRTLASK